MLREQLRRFVAEKIAGEERPGRLKRRCSLPRTALCCSDPAGSWMGEGSVIEDQPRQYEVLAVRNRVGFCSPEGDWEIGHGGVADD